MNPLLTSTALGLIAAWPAAGLGWVLGTLADKLTPDPEPRAWAWGVATALAPTTLTLALSTSLLPKALTAPVEKITLGGKVTAGASAAFNQVTVAVPLAPQLSEILTAGLAAAAAGGLLVAATRQFIGLLRLKAIVRNAIAAPPELSLAVRDAAQRLGCGVPDVQVSEEIQQPMLAGLLNPVILLPANLTRQLDAERLLPICLHELAHLKRNDNWRLVIEALWNGLLWMAAPQSALSVRAAAARE